MDEIFHQLGELVLGSVPTMVLFVLLVAAYETLVRRPLDRVLLDRRSRTSGAMEQAQGAIAAAEAETSVYEDKLRGAKAQIFEAREQRLKQWNADREAALEQVRSSAQERIRSARQQIEASAAEARSQIGEQSEDLTARILTAVLPSGIRAEAAQ